MVNTRVTLPIEGMSCGSCAATVQQRLLDAEGVVDANVNFATGKATVALGSDGTAVADLVKVVREAGYDCARTSTVLDVEGLDYALGVSLFEDNVRKLPGVLSVSANQATEQVAVDYVPGLIGAADLEQAVSEAGLALSAPIPTDDPVERERLKHARDVKALAAEVWRRVCRSRHYDGWVDAPHGGHEGGRFVWPAGRASQRPPSIAVPAAV